MAFEVYKPRGEKLEKLPTVSFSKNSIVLNNIAREKIKSLNVELAYDKDIKSVRISAVDEDGMQIKKTRLFAKGFYKHFDIHPKGKYEAKFNEDERALYVDIND